MGKSALNMYLSVACLLGSILVAIAPALAQEKRLTAPQLFPSKTIAYFRINDARELRDRFSQSSIGKLFEDQKMQSFLGTLQEGILKFTETMQNDLGLSLEELLAIPNGEFAFAVVPTPKAPITCLMMEVGPEQPAVEILFKRHFDRTANLKRNETKIGDIQVVQLNDGESPNFGYFLHEGVFVATPESDYISTLAKVWAGLETKHVSLSENIDFTNLLSRCVGTQGERPQVSFYVDPVGIFRENIRESPNVIMTLAAIKSIGLDGIKAAGGSLILATNDFDSILHLHLTLDNPRPGVLSAVRPKNGSTEPEAWVDDSVVSYLTMNWDFRATLNAIRDIMEAFAGEGSFASNVEKSFSARFNLDLRKDVIEQLTGRVSMATIILPERKINSQSRVIGVHLKDESFGASKLLPKFYEQVRKNDSRWKEKSVDGITVYYLPTTSNPERVVRRPSPAFCLLKNTILLSDAIEALEHAISVQKGGGTLLSDSVEFKLIRSKIKDQLHGNEFSVMTYTRPDEQLKLFYELALDGENVRRLKEASQGQAFLESLVQALENKTLPPFEDIAKYLAPAGGFLTEEDNGLHFTTFTVRRD